MSNLKIFGERVTVVEVDEEFESEIAMPARPNTSYQLGRVHTVGDGRVNGLVQPIHVKKGDTVLIQMNAYQEQNSRFIFDGMPMYVIHQGDLIARIKSTVIKLENFEILGPWALVELFVDRGKDCKIILPETAEIRLTEFQRHRLIQVGSLIKRPMQPGQEVVVERTMVHPIDIDHRRYGFIHGERVLGVVEDIKESVLPELREAGAVDFFG